MSKETKNESSSDQYMQFRQMIVRKVNRVRERESERDTYMHKVNENVYTIRKPVTVFQVDGNNNECWIIEINPISVRPGTWN